MSRSESKTIFYAPESPMRGGRKKKFIKIAVQASGLSGLADTKIFPVPRGSAAFPTLMKLSHLPGLLGVSRASVYRMPKQGLKTVRITNNGDKHVRREDLEEFLQLSGDQAANVQRRRGQK